MLSLSAVIVALDKFRPQAGKEGIIDTNKVLNMRSARSPLLDPISLVENSSKEGE